MLSTTKQIFSRSKLYRLKIDLFLILNFFLFGSLEAQDSSRGKVYQGLYLDEVLVNATRSGEFDPLQFIEKIKQDTTFYKAFKTLRLHSYSMLNDIEILDKEGEVKDSYHSISKQHVEQHCRTMQVFHEKHSAGFFDKKGNYNYYTAKLYAHLFFTKGKICGENNVVGQSKQVGSTKYEEQLRTLIFNPGQRISGIPGIGDNVAIFEEPTYSKYQFKLARQVYNNDTCYVFTAIPKEGFKDEVVINELKTWIRVSDGAIVARNYNLSYRTWIYDFDVDMKVKLMKLGTELIPYDIQYRGNWHALTKNREIATFTATFSDFN